VACAACPACAVGAAASATGAAAIPKEAPPATSRAASILSGAFISIPFGVLTSQITDFARNAKQRRQHSHFCGGARCDAMTVIGGLVGRSIHQLCAHRSRMRHTVRLLTSH